MDATLVTENAEIDDLSDDDYREIFEELCQGVSLRGFVDKIDSHLSHTRWGKWKNGELGISREMQNELRVALAKLRRPITVIESMGNVDPNAQIWQVGNDSTVHRVIKLATALPVDISSNGTVSVRDHTEAHVTTVTQSQGANRDKRHRLTVTVENFEWLQAQGLSVNDAIIKLRGGALWMV